MFFGKLIIITMGGNDLPFRAGSQSPGLFHGLKKKIFDFFQKQFRGTTSFSPIVERAYYILPSYTAWGFSTLERPFSYAFSYHSHRFQEILINSMRNPVNITIKERSFPMRIHTRSPPSTLKPVFLQLNKKIQEENMLYQGRYGSKATV